MTMFKKKYNKPELYQQYLPTWCHLSYGKDKGLEHQKALTVQRRVSRTYCMGQSVVINQY
jgi:hypothetical protein